MINNNKINILNPNITDEYIIYQHNFMKDKLNLALSIVKQYIFDNKLLIVGGMSIDFALKINNSTLYNDEYQIPDFDIMSPDNVYHANKIGTILCSNKFENVNVVPAIHHTTVRVQLLGFTVFDSTYIPEYIYNKIPYLIYNDFKFIHPYFQKINQLLSLSFLFNVTGPEYNITHRFKKDIDRFNLLDKYYNVINDIDTKESKTIIDNYKKKILDLNLITSQYEINIIQKHKASVHSDNIIINNLDIELNDNISFNINTDICYHGIIAYNLIYQKYKNIFNKLNNSIKFNNNDLKYIDNLKQYILIDNNIEISEDNVLNIELYEDFPITFVNNNNNIDKIIEKLKKNSNDINKKNNVMEYIPKHVLCNLGEVQYLEIYDLFGSLLSVNIIEFNNNKYLIANYNYILVYFLTKYYLNDDINQKQIYLLYYISLKNIIQIMQYIYNNYENEFNEIEPFYNSVFNYSINTLGINNYPSNYLYFIKNFNYLVYNKKNLTDLPSKNYIKYPDCEIKKTFDLEKSSLYDIELNNNIKDTNYSLELNELLNLT